MKTLSSILLLICIGFSSSFALAHSDHDHGARPISATEAKSVALDASKILTKSDKGLGFGKLPESWNKVPLSQTKIEKQTSDYFIVAVTNEEEKKTLYILISAYGEAYDANFTGKFEGLNSDK
ncbi:MAG: DUF6488 family protein [Sulfitobacter sp.]|jgi:hypothetical protein|tara:strand:- start:783 stop:1151 length:369 start_codon:yes stop_codon:yes gene_type:complete